MFKVATVIFRECLEISLLFGVILASTRHIKNSKLYIIAGAMIGVFLAIMFAFSLKTITVAFGAYGDELFDCFAMLFTAMVISWTVVWMQGYDKKIEKNLNKLSQKISIGAASKMVLAALAASTILREGAEIILIIYSISSASLLDSEHIFGLLIGGASGFIAGIMIYFGLINFVGKYIFKVSGILLMLVAAGLASEAAGILTSAGIIEIYQEALWDSSWLIDNNSVAGKLLHITIGYDSKPNAMQVIFYLAIITITLIMIKIRKNNYNKLI